MNRSTLLPAAYALDHFAGDPEWFPHPVRLIGAAITHGESLLRRGPQKPQAQLLSGAALTLAIVASTYAITAVIIRRTRLHSPTLGSTAELALAWTCLAGRNLDQEATAVTNALHTGDLPHARTRLARIVGRDTANLGTQDISRAVIETVAESASDGIIAPLSYMALGGVPLAMAYKAINTLDSMIGHADERYFYFGKAAARLDDAANYLPSRLSALTLIAAAKFFSHADPHTAWCTWRRDGSSHRSPNAGQPESAISGALHVALGGGNTYAGEFIPAPRIGVEFPPASPALATRAIHLVSAASFLALGTAILLTSLFRSSQHD